MDDDKIFLETDLLYTQYEIGFAMVGADGKTYAKMSQQPHSRPRVCETGLLLKGSREVSYGLNSRKHERDTDKVSEGCLAPFRLLPGSRFLSTESLWPC